MADIATLGYKVDSSELAKGERALDSQVKAAGRAETATAKLERQWKSLGKQIGIGLTVLGGASLAVFARYIKNTIEAERVQAQLEQRIKSTGGAAGLSAIELNEMADALQNATTFDDEAITEAQSLLLTFTKIGKNEFPKATEAVLDMATALQVDLKSAALQVGKALNDPVLGVTALSRAGVQFSAEQKEVIKHLVETGRQAEAQAIILRELETQMGGSARAARDTLGGALQALKNSFDNLLEGDAGGMTGVRDGIEDLNDTLNDPGIKQGVDDLVSGLLRVGNVALTAAKYITQSWQAVGALMGSLTVQAGVAREVAVNIQSFGFADGSIKEALARSERDRQQLKETLDEIANPKERATFRNIESRTSSTESEITTLDPVLVREPNGKKSATDKAATDAERDAKRIAKAIREIADSQREWQTELEGTGNPILDSYAQRLDQVRESAEKYEELKVPQEQVAAFTAEMQRLAMAIKDKELAEFQREFDMETQEMAASMAGTSTATIEYERALHDLNEQLKQNLITQKMYDERVSAEQSRMNAAPEGVLRDLNLEIEALGKSAEWIAKRNALLNAGVLAESEYGIAILDTVTALYEEARVMEDQISLMDGLRDGARGFVDDLASGVGIFDALTNAAGKFADKLFDIATDRVIASLLGEQGTGGGGSGGDLIGMLINGFLGGMGGGASSGSTGGGGGFGDFSQDFSNSFGSGWGSSWGGGRAFGGDVRRDRMYQVGERNRPELLNMGGQQLLIPGDRGRVEPMGAGDKSTTVNVTSNNYYRAPYDPRTENQKNQKMAMETSLAVRRNN